MVLLHQSISRFLINMSGLFAKTSLSVCIPWFHKTITSSYSVTGLGMFISVISVYYYYYYYYYYYFKVLLGCYVFINVCCRLPIPSCSHIQYHNPFSKLLGKIFWILCYKNYQTTTWSNLTSATAYIGRRLRIVWTGRGLLSSVRYYCRPLSW
jgi:hypothetical protein